MPPRPTRDAKVNISWESGFQEFYRVRMDSIVLKAINEKAKPRLIWKRRCSPALTCLSAHCYWLHMTNWIRIDGFSNPESFPFIRKHSGYMLLVLVKDYVQHGAQKPCLGCLICSSTFPKEEPSSSQALRESCPLAEQSTVRTSSRTHICEYCASIQISQNSPKTSKGYLFS